MMQVLTDVDTRGWDEFAEQATRELDTDQQKKWIRAMALEFIKEVIPRTPVDTGRARAGWTLERRGPDNSHFKVRTRLLGGAEGELFNGVPYISFLELGSSQQAPGGFVRQTLREISGNLVDESERRTEAALRAANIKARRKIGLRQGIGRGRGGSTRFNLRAR